MLLPGPKRDYTLAINLTLAEKMDRQTDIIALAGRLTAGDAAADEVFAVLKTAYQSAGCLLPADALRRYLEGQNPQGILAEILLGLLSPLMSMGAVRMGEKMPARTSA